jgi:hypothetical protein
MERERAGKHVGTTLARARRCKQAPRNYAHNKVRKKRGGKVGEGESNYIKKNRKQKAVMYVEETGVSHTNSNFLVVELALI